MKIGFIGAGKVGAAFGTYLTQNGFEVAGYYSRSIESASNSAVLTSGKAYIHIEELVQECEIIVITTPDDAITSVGLFLAQLSVSWEPKTVMHMSGIHSSACFEPLVQKGATACSLHPMLAFGDYRTAVEALKTVPFTLEGEGEHIIKIKHILKICGNQWTQIQSNQKALYHTAACMLSNYLVTLMDTGLSMLVSAGFEPEQAKVLAEPLVRGTVKNIFSMGTEKALTGPISRGDAGTVALHVKKLSEFQENWQTIYKQLGISTVDLALKAGRINESAHDLIKGVLKNE